MKRTVMLLISIVLFFSIASTINASESAPTQIEKLLKPYQEVIDKVNADLGSKYFIPKDNQEEVYENIKKYSLEEFEKKIRYEYKTYFLNQQNTEPTEPYDPGKFIEKNILDEDEG